MTRAARVTGQPLAECNLNVALISESDPDFAGAPVVRKSVQACPARSPVETRRLAIQLERRPVPHLTRKEVESRLRIGPDTGRKILRSPGIDAGAEKSGMVPLTALLTYEGILDPLAVWLMSTDDERAILRADLLTPEELCRGLGALPPMHMNSLYRRLEDGRLRSIRVGKQHRFRRSLASAQRWLAERAEVSA